MIDATDNHKQTANEVLDSIPITHKAKAPENSGAFVRLIFFTIPY